MQKKFKKKKMRHGKFHRISKSEAMHSHSDPEGKVIFQYEGIIPGWMISKLTNQISEDDKSEICKCWGISV